MRGRSRSGALVAVVLVLSLSMASLAWVGPARANGRYPGAGQIGLDRADASRVVVRTTFGLLTSRDRGRDMRWICEEAAFFGSGSYDPAIAVAPGGAVFAGLATGISRGSADGCTWERVSGPLDGRYVIDVSVDRDGRVIAVFLGDFGIGYFGYSTDGGATFRAVQLPDDASPLTVDAAPSRPLRVYASARAAFPQFGVMLRSDDGGLTWSKSTFDLGGDREPYIAAVDPVDPDRLFLRLFGDTNERLLMSTDGGLTFREVLRTPSYLFGFAISPDGAAIAVGSPAEGLRVGRPALLTAGGGALSPIDSRCLAWDARGLLACANQPADPFTLGEFVGGGGAPEPRYRLADTKPLECPTGTRVATLCPAAWRDVAPLLGLGPPDAGADAARPVDDAGIPADGDSGHPGGSLRASGGCGGCAAVDVNGSWMSMIWWTIPLLVGGALAGRGRQKGRYARL